MEKSLRLASYNIEWFNSLFDERDRLLLDDGPSARYGISRRDQAQAIADVLRALEADGILIVEAPDSNYNSHRSSARALEGFARHYGLRQSSAIQGFASDTQQEITFLYDPNCLTASHDPKGGSNGLSPRFDGTFHYDLNADLIGDQIRFSKPPLEIALTTAAGQNLRLIGVHAKSKNPHGAKDEAQAMRISIENRRKQLAQCIWIRARVEEELAQGKSLLVMGDFNDGPGLDEYEKLFGRSGVEIVLGDAADPEQKLYDPHAAMALRARMGFAPTTARFYLPMQKRYFEALLDFIMVSNDLRQLGPKWHIWHPYCDPHLLKDPALQNALITASDHFPVSIDLPQ